MTSENEIRDLVRRVVGEMADGEVVILEVGVTGVCRPSRLAPTTEVTP